MSEIVRMPSNVTPQHTEYLVALAKARPVVGQRFQYRGEEIEVVSEPVDITGLCTVYNGVEMPSFRWDARFPDGTIARAYSLYLTESLTK
jgi:hypothetical protein